MDIQKVEATAAQLKNVAQVVLSTSCSLAHVPYSLKPETKLPDAIKKSLAFLTASFNLLTAIVFNHSGRASLVLSSVTNPD